MPNPGITLISATHGGNPPKEVVATIGREKFPL
jgi:hypothetical protein